MRILIVCQWYLPEPAHVVSELAQTLAEPGNDVTVLTGFPSYPLGEIYPGYKLKLWAKETVAGVNVVRVPMKPDHSRSGRGRMLYYVSYALAASALGPFILKRPDVVFVYHPPLTSVIPGWWLSKVWRRPYVLQIQDMWPESLAATGMMNNERVLGYVSRVADFAYRGAKRVFVISPGFKRNLVDKGVPEDKISVVSNSVDLDFYRPSPPDAELAAKHSLTGKFNVMFAGNLGEAQGLETVLEAAKILQTSPTASIAASADGERHETSIQFVIVGDGTAYESLKAKAAADDLDNVKFLGRQPFEAMTPLYGQADVLLLHLKDQDLFRITIPSKTFAYMASGKPILAAVNGDAADVVESANAGVKCAPEDPAALADAVRAFAAMSPQERMVMGNNARESVENSFGRHKLIGQIEQEMAQIVETDREGRRRGVRARLRRRRQQPHR